MTNKYTSTCSSCGKVVLPGEGELKRVGRAWKVTHFKCAPVESGVDEFVIGGNSYYRNKKGRCEDAPCCGCCTI